MWVLLLLRKCDLAFWGVFFEKKIGIYNLGDTSLKLLNISFTNFIKIRILQIMWKD